MGCLKRYDSVQDILKEFFELRLHYYKLRKDWLLGSLGAEASKLSNQARFVLEKIEGKISIGRKYLKYLEHYSPHWKVLSLCFSSNPFFSVQIENKSKRELIRMLVQKGYESDPVAAWAKAQEKVWKGCLNIHQHSSAPKKIIRYTVIVAGHGSKSVNPQ